MMIFCKNSNINCIDKQRFENLILLIFAQKIHYRVDSYYNYPKISCRTGKDLNCPIPGR